MSLFSNARSEFLKGSINLLTDDIRVILTTTYSSSWQNLSDIPNGNRIASSTPLTGKTIFAAPNGRYSFDADDTLFPSLTGNAISYLIIYKHTGDEATSTLIDYRNFNFTPLGVNMTVLWNNGDSRVFALYPWGSQNEFYSKVRPKFYQGEVAMLTDTIKLALVTAGYVWSRDEHEFFDEVGSGNVIASQELGTKTINTSGYFKAANLLFPSLAGDPVTQVVIYKDTGNPATSPLIARFGTADQGLPYTPNGNDMAIGWTNSNGLLQF